MTVASTLPSRSTRSAPWSFASSDLGSQPGPAPARRPNFQGSERPAEFPDEESRAGGWETENLRPQPRLLDPRLDDIPSGLRPSIHLQVEKLTTCSLNQLISALQQRPWERKPERLSGSQIQYEFIPARLYDRQIGRFPAAKNAVYVLDTAKL